MKVQMQDVYEWFPSGWDNVCSCFHALGIEI
jgi:hypothetical protein